ncbi:MAG: HutD family protein [Gammaproteobacteria bacterium]
MQTPDLKIVRKDSFTATPWKNGGGITHEAIRVPATGDPFHWRVSVAHIDASGAFSQFAAHDRKMVLLKGEGIELRFADGMKKTLRRVGELIEFDGAVAAHCELLDGPCVDLNLMILKSARAVVRVEHVVESLELSTAVNETTLVFPLSGSITLAVTTQQSVTLEPWDLAILSHGVGRLRQTKSVSPAPWSGTPSSNPSAITVFVATLKFVSGEQQTGLGV